MLAELASPLPRIAAQTSFSLAFRLSSSAIELRPNFGQPVVLLYVRLLEDKTQPTYDLDMVPEATLDDLNQRLLAAVLTRQRMLHPRAFEQARDEEMYLDLRIAVRDKDVLRPTLAGLLALGTYPQKFFPRLTVTFAAYPGIDKADVPDVKFLDNEKMIGPIPTVIADTVAAVRRNMRTGGVMDGIMRVDVPDYPLVAVREAVCNALMHRDYSPMARGAQVQVNLYADRLEFLSPGGLYGMVTTDTIGRLGYSSTRNQYLADLLESTPYEFAPYEGSFVAENRGTGFRLMTRALENNHMQPPIVRDSISMFSLTFKRNTDDPNQRSSSFISMNPAAWPFSSASAGSASAADSASATSSAGSVASAASPASTGTLRSAAPVGGSALDRVYAYIKNQEPCSASQASQALGISRSTFNYRVNKLIEAGRVERLGETRSKNQQYVTTT